jgi:hypothetical protein
VKFATNTTLGNTSSPIIDVSGNLGFFSSSGSFGGGSKILYIANATTVPSSNPSVGGILYVSGGALKFRGVDGTITTIAPA